MKNSILIAILFLILIKYSNAQSLQLDQTFNPNDPGWSIGAGAAGTVYTAKLQADGKIVFGGSIQNYNGINLKSIARIQIDGSLDSTFSSGTGVNGAIKDLDIQSNGKIIVGGFFNVYNGIAANCMARILSDGSHDNTFPTLSGSITSFESVKIQTDGKILAGGIFTSVNGYNTSGLIRLDSTGAVDASFATNLGTGFNGNVHSISIQTDNKIIVAGTFASFNGIPSNQIARLNPDGTLDNSFNAGNGPNGTVYDCKIQPDGKIIIGGLFNNVNGTPIGYIARLNSDGSLDNSFNTGPGFIGIGVNSISLQQDGKIIIGGEFSSASGILVNNFTRLDTTGNIDTTFSTGQGMDNVVNAILVQADLKIVFAGDMRTYNGRTAFGIARALPGGLPDSLFNPSMGVTAYVRSVSIQSDNKILISGGFISYNGIVRKHIARIFPDGTLDTSFDPGAGPNLPPYSKLQPDDKILIWYDLTHYNFVPVNGLARLNPDGSLDSTFDIGLGIPSNKRINNLAIQSDGKLIIAGNFSSFNSIPVGNIARLNTDGSLDTTFNIQGAGTNNTISNIKLQTDGKILISGDFTTYNGMNAVRVARLNVDGSIDNTFNVGTGFSHNPARFEIQSDGKIILTGPFSTVNGITRKSVARLNSDGSLDLSFDPGTGILTSQNIFKIFVQADGKYLVGGSLQSYNGNPVNNFARLNHDGSLDTTFVINSGFNNLVLNFVFQTDGKMIAAGSFTAFNNMGRNGIARFFYQPVGIDELGNTKKALDIFPNPSNGHFTIAMDDEFREGKLYLYNNLGECVFSESIITQNTSISVDLPPGIYIIKAISRNNIYSNKFVVQ